MIMSCSPSVHPCESSWTEFLPWVDLGWTWCLRKTCSFPCWHTDQLHTPRVPKYQPRKKYNKNHFHPVYSITNIFTSLHLFVGERVYQDSTRNSQRHEDCVPGTPRSWVQLLWRPVPAVQASASWRFSAARQRYLPTLGMSAAALPDHHT